MKNENFVTMREKGPIIPISPVVFRNIGGDPGCFCPISHSISFEKDVMPLADPGRYRLGGR
jgi:hypothetical protein